MVRPNLQPLSRRAQASEISNRNRTVDRSELDDLSDLLLAATLTDDPKPPKDQSSNKLWNSREEHQNRISSEHPSSFTPIAFPEALDAMARLKRFEASAAPRPQPLQTRPSRSSFRPPSSKILSALQLLDELEQHCREVFRSLDIPVEGEELLNSAELQLRMQKAKEKVEAIKKSLAAARLGSNGTVREKKQFLEELIQKIEVKFQALENIFPLLPETGPQIVESSHIFVNPVEDLDITAQLVILVGVICNVLIGVAGDACDFIIAAFSLVIDSLMAVHKIHDENGKEEWHPDDAFIRRQLPKTLYAALNRINIDSEMTVFAVCPECHFPHPPSQNRITNPFSYPSTCTNSRIHNNGTVICSTSLLIEGKNKPIKPFLVPSLPDFLARELSNVNIENACLKACDDALKRLHIPDPNHQNITNVFQANFMKTFRGPAPDKLFIDREGKIRLAFAIQVDFFNPNGTRKRGNHDSIGILSLANLNLPENIRYQTDHIYMTIIPGPREPELDNLAHYLKPIVDQLLIGWKRGFRISRTASSPGGNTVEVAVVLSINDLPAARKVDGSGGVKSNWLCTRCNLYGRDSAHRTDFKNWELKDPALLLQQATAYRHAQSKNERDKLFEEHAVRWSELRRLPYWDSTRMLVVDSMHAILEGLVHYHCRRVLRLDTQFVKSQGKAIHPAFIHSWKPYDPTYNLHIERRKHEVTQRDLEEDQIVRIQETLQLPFESDVPRSLTKEKLQNKLRQFRVAPLRYVWDSLNLSASLQVINKSGETNSVSAEDKSHFIQLLVDWRMTKPKVPDENLLFLPSIVNEGTIRHIQNVIKETVTPAWINHVPSNYCDPKAGTIKADEWRTLSTVYLPIALVILWGEKDGRPCDKHSRPLQVLDHTMALFQATDLLCRYSMTPRRAESYRMLLKQWVDDLYTVHPHTLSHEKKTNVHVAFHLYDFLLLFGPVISWWCFPFERLIGTLQKVNTNSHIGGEMEATIVKAHARSANLRRFLNREDCPPLVCILKDLFNKAFPSSSKQLSSEGRLEATPAALSYECAHYTYNGVNYSRSQTHIGNSLVLFYASLTDTKPIAGSIQKIEINKGQPFFHICRQQPLPSSKHDPFCHYPWFFAQSYSSEMSTLPPDRVPASRIVSHVARFNFSNGRSVILNLSRVSLLRSRLHRWSQYLTRIDELISIPVKT